MKLFSDTTPRKIRYYRWLPVVLIALLTLAVLLIIRRYPGEKRFSVVHMYGKGGAINFSKSYQLGFFHAGIKHKGALLAEKGDILGFNNSFYHFTDFLTDTLQMDDSGDSMVYVNGKLHSLVINKDEDLLPWFRQMKTTDLDKLSAIYFAAPVPDSYINFLKEIARTRPNLSLVFEENDSYSLVTDYFKKADFFKPRFVSLPVTNASLPELARWKNAECLYINLADSIISSPLPAIPSMKQCILYSDYVVSVSPGFFNNNPQLEKLNLLLDRPFYSLLSPLDKLDELILNNGDNTADLKELGNKTEALSVLIISGKCTGIDQLLKAKKVKWLGLPENTSQAEFDQLTASSRKLQVVELNGNSGISSYASLQDLPDLSALVITDTVTDKTSLASMKQLRYLSLPMENKADSAFLQDMEKALPGCIIVANSGACLGSGWLLLLLPLVIAFSLLIRKKIKSPGHART